MRLSSQGLNFLTHKVIVLTSQGCCGLRCAYNSAITVMCYNSDKTAYKLNKEGGEALSTYYLSTFCLPAFPFRDWERENCLGTRDPELWLPHLVACEHFQKCLLKTQYLIKPQTYLHENLLCVWRVDNAGILF